MKTRLSRRSKFIMSTLLECNLSYTCSWQGLWYLPVFIFQKKKCTYKEMLRWPRLLLHSSLLYSFSCVPMLLVFPDWLSLSLLKAVRVSTGRSFRAQTQSLYLTLWFGTSTMLFPTPLSMVRHPQGLSTQYSNEYRNSWRNVSNDKRDKAVFVERMLLGTTVLWIRSTALSNI